LQFFKILWRKLLEYAACVPNLVDEHDEGQGVGLPGEGLRGIVAEADELVVELGDVAAKDITELGFLREIFGGGPGGGGVVEDEGNYQGVAELLGKDDAGVLLFGRFLEVFEDEGDVEEHLEGGAEVDFGLVFKDDNDKEGEAFPPDFDALDGV
jgi:hypothetical protein